MVNEEFVDGWTFPQFRFCPLGYNETLPVSKSIYNTPITKSSIDVVYEGVSFWPSDPIDWNYTIWNTFTNTSSQTFKTCIYPCFSTSWPLRDDSEITAYAYDTDPVDSDIAWYINFLLYLLISTSGLSSLTVFTVKCFGWYERSNLRIRLRQAASSRPFLTRATMHSYWLAGCTLYFFIVDNYVKFASPIPILCFVVWIEWTMWYDLPGETFWHIGQWGTLVVAGLLFIAAIVGHYSSRVATYYKAYVAQHCGGDTNKAKIRLDTLKDMWRMRESMQRMPVSNALDAMHESFAS